MEIQERDPLEEALKGTFYEKDPSAEVNKRGPTKRSHQRRSTKEASQRGVISGGQKREAKNKNFATRSHHEDYKKGKPK